jgi:exonuclease 1
MLKHFGVTPYMVFDGDFLPSKAGTEEKRAKRREESKKLGMELMKAGKRTQARDEFQHAIDITPEMARHLIEELKKLDIAYVVAPYEADAQLVYLERQGLINGILSDDSDLLVFGAKRLLTKLDKFGNCIEINRRDFCACREISLTGWTDAEFRRMAILSGCDYLEGIRNMGLKTAYKMVRKYKSPERLIRMLAFQGEHRVSEDYLPKFFQAELTFIHQRVFCPIKKDLVFLTEPEPGQNVEDMPFIGAAMSTELARAVASGDVNPISKEPIIMPTLPTKRRHSPSNASTTVRPQPPPAKPIDSYFKGHHRVPMGEMDPNCFSVDPQRVAAITQNGLVPRVFPLPRPYLEETTTNPEPQLPPPRANTGRSSTSATSPRLLRRRTEPLASMVSQFNSPTSTVRRKSNTPLPQSLDESAAPVSSTGQRPPKKPRLCKESDVARDERADQRSKFFPTKAVAKKSNKTDLLLPSDDDINAALMALPDVDGWGSCSQSQKPMPIFQDTQETRTSFEDESQSTRAGDDISSTPPSETSQEVEPVSKSDDLSSPPASTPLRSTIRQRFSYAAPTFSSISASRRVSSSQPTPSSVISRSSSVFTPSSAASNSTAPSSAALSTGRPRNSSIPTKKASPGLTPLQRIGANALHRKHGQNPPTSPKMGPPKRPIRNAFAGLSKLNSVPVNPSFVPLPKVDLAEVEALNKPCGSEDQIIPDSDGENDLDTLEDEKYNDGSARTFGRSKAFPALDLSKFLFS